MHIVKILVMFIAVAACGSTEPARGEPSPQPPEKAPTEAPAASGALFPVEDVFTIAGRGTVVTGKVERGTIKLGDTLELIHGGQGRAVTVKGLDKFRAIVEQAGPGDVVGVLLQGVGRDEVARGDVLATPGTLVARTALSASIALLPSGEGGRKTPVFDGYRPMLVAWTASVTATVALPAGRESLAPGEQAEVTITLQSPLPLELGTTFSLREGGRTVATGKVTGWR